MKKFLTVFMVFMLLCVTALAATTPAVQTADGYDALVKAAGNIALPNAPEGATDVAYTLINAERPIAQVRYTLDGATYYLRASICDSAEEMADISGMDMLFAEEKFQTLTIPETENAVGKRAVNGAYAVSYWFIEEKLCAYSVFTSEMKDEKTFDDMTALLYKAAQNVSGVQEQGNQLVGTVTKVSKTAITVKGTDKQTYEFTISECTVNADAASVKNKATVRINYTGEYSKRCEALSITLIAKASGGGSKPSGSQKASGTVTAMMGNVFEMKTDKGKTLSFMIEDAKVKGGDTAEVGDKVSVVYAYKNKAYHLTSVTFSKTPTPKPTATPGSKKITVKGTITSWYGDFLSIETDKGKTYDFNIRNAKRKGDYEDAQTGDDAKVVYYVNSAGDNVVTEVTFTLTLFH